MAGQPTDPKLDITDQPAARPSSPVTQKAVALGFERDKDNAPRILASGKGAVAEQILQVAFDRGIKVREDAALVNILSVLEVDSLIPLEAFAAVAEILAYVYQANAGAKQRAMESE